MKRKLLLAAMLALFSLLATSPVRAAPFIDFSATVVASCAPGFSVANCSDPPPPAYLLVTVDGVNYYAVHYLDSGSGAATAISGFNSLAGVSPDALTLSFGDLELVDFISTSTMATEVYGEGDGSPLFFNLFTSGSLIATGTDLLVNIVTNKTTGQATGFGSVRLTGGGVDLAFFDEVVALTGGNGILQITLHTVCVASVTPCTPLASSDPVTYQVTGTFTIPEPSTLLLLGFGLPGLAARRARRWDGGGRG